MLADRPTAGIQSPKKQASWRLDAAKLVTSTKGKIMAWKIGLTFEVLIWGAFITGDIWKLEFGNDIFLYKTSEPFYLATLGLNVAELLPQESEQSGSAVK